jgi:hypothetical protein
MRRAIGIAAALVGLGLVVLLLVTGSEGNPSAHADEVRMARQLLASEAYYERYGAEGLKLVRQGERECSEAAYLCEDVAKLNEETGGDRMAIATERIEEAESDLRLLDPAAVEEAEGSGR